MKCCKELAVLEQGPTAVIGSSVAPDLMAYFTATLGPAFVEAKAPQEDHLKISKADRDRRRAFAESFCLPLYYAITIRGIWGLFPDEYVVKKDGLIKVQDFVDSRFNEVTGHYFVLFPAGLTLHKTYVAEGSTTGSLLHHPEYGHLISFSVTHGSTHIDVHDADAGDHRIIIPLLAPLQEFQGTKQGVSRDGNRTTLQARLTTPVFVPLSLFLLGPLQRMASREGEPINATRYLKMLQDGGSPFLSLEVVESVLAYLEGAGLPIIRVK